MKKLLFTLSAILMLSGCSPEDRTDWNKFNIDQLNSFTGYYNAEMSPSLDERIKTLEEEVDEIQKFKRNYFTTITHYEMLTDCPAEKEVLWDEVKDLDVHFCSKPYLKLFTRYIPKDND